MITKQDFLLREDIIFLNHGSFGACPKELLERQRSWQERLEQQPVLFHRDIADLMHQARTRVASYLHARPADLVYVTNSTYGVNVAAHALRQLLEPGDEVLMTDHEYGACIRTWELRLRHTGATITYAQLPIPSASMPELVDRIWNEVTDRTRIIFLSSITSPTATLLPVEQICAKARERGIITVIDASHVPGHIDLNLETLNADVVTGNFHKWMCTPKGSAFLWVHPSLQTAFIPFVVSWGDLIATTGEGHFVADHEYLGTRDVSPFLTVPDALDWMERVEWKAIQTRANHLRNTTMEALLKIPGVGPVSDWRPDGLQMGAVTLPQRTNVEELKDTLYRRYRIEVVVHRVKDHPMVRFSVHAHTSESDLKALVSALSELLNTNAETP